MPPPSPVPEVAGADGIYQEAQPLGDPWTLQTQREAPRFPPEFCTGWDARPFGKGCLPLGGRPIPGLLRPCGAPLYPGETRLACYTSERTGLSGKF